MQIKNIKIKNIRSYTDEVIDFPKGTTLLSGNIGVGKSTILLAIEFALFGITKEMPGSALLRNGTEKGAVELNFQIEDKDIIIKRTLKRGSSVTQDAGWITINNAKKEATATELKQNILSLLKYPQELLTKSKSLVYRYTVYTPQEEMKNILVGNKEFRLDTLRKVFGIDKYKRIKENTEMFITKIKMRNREFAVAIADLETQRDEAAIIEEKTKELTTTITTLLPAIERIKETIKEKKDAVETMEKRIKEALERKKDLEVCEAQIRHKLEENRKNKERKEESEARRKQLEEEIKKEGEKAVDTNAIINNEKKIAALEQELREVANKVQELKTSKAHAEKIIADIAKLDICPICKQKVGEKHTNKVKEGEEKKIDAYNTGLTARKQEEEQKGIILTKTKEILEELKKEEQKINILQLKKETIKEKKKEVSKIEEHIATMKKEIGVLNIKKEKLLATVSDTEQREIKYGEIKKELEKVQQEEKEREIKKATLEKELENNTANLKRLQETILYKTKIKEKITYLKLLQHWLEQQFINLTLTIEKKIMSKVHTDFNALFQKWFEMLVDTENIKVKIDEEFTPVIEQNGHNIDYSYLSGGEKTAAALAYRLALNQVVNTIVSTIRTKDVLILDEPTDGFSSEQLDRLRNVLEELDAKQVIVVSHENKIESFVENVIRLEKNEHTSSVSYT